MLKPWRPFDGCELQPFDVDALPAQGRDLLLSYTIEFVSLGFDPVGDYRLGEGTDAPAARYFQSADGAVLGWITVQDHAPHTLRFASILRDGTCVQSTTDSPHAPWSCCRFPVYINFTEACGLEALLVAHLTSLVELEHGCGSTNRYDAAQLPDVLTYMHALVHETLHGLGASPATLPVPPAANTREVFAH